MKWLASRTFAGITWGQAIVIFTLTIASLAEVRSVDFRVYWYAVTGFFSGIRPAYGPLSGIGAPMDYVYPPVTYLLLYPIKYFSLHTAGLLWMLAEICAVVISVLASVRAYHLTFKTRSLILCVCLMLPYLVLSVRYGNVQPFAIAFVFLSLSQAERRPWLSGLLFSLAVTLKTTPLFFLPWLFRRPKAILAFLFFMAVLWITPVASFGATAYTSLLHDWYHSATSIGATSSEFHYFPGQTLRALCLRFLTPIASPIDGYPKVNFLSLTPDQAVGIWQIAALAVYVIAVAAFLRSDKRKLPLWHGLAFVLYSMLQPFAVKVSLLSLGPPAVIGAAYLTQPTPDRKSPQDRWASRFYIAAAVLSLGASCIQTRVALRYLQTIGVDFWVSMLLAIAFLFWIAISHRGNSVPVEMGIPPRETS